MKGLCCPVCESANTRLEVFCEDKALYQLVCYSCGANSEWQETKEKAIKQWEIEVES